MPVISRKIIESAPAPIEEASLAILDPVAAEIFAAWEADLQKPPRTYTLDDSAVLALAPKLKAQAWRNAQARTSTDHV